VAALKTAKKIKTGKLKTAKQGRKISRQEDFHFHFPAAKSSCPILFSFLCLQIFLS